VNNYLDLIIKALKEGTLQPHNNPEHLLMLVIFINGYYVGLRGSQEHVQLMLGDIVRDAQYTLEHGPELAGLHYCGVQVPFHKMKQLKLGSTTMSSDQEQVFTIAEDPNNDVFCPWKIYQLYLSRCHPNATKFYAKPFTPKQREDWKAEHRTMSGTWPRRRVAAIVLTTLVMSNLPVTTNGLLKCVVLTTVRKSQDMLFVL